MCHPALKCHPHDARQCGNGSEVPLASWAKSLVVRLSSLKPYRLFVLPSGHARIDQLCCAIAEKKEGVVAGESEFESVNP